MSVENMYDSNGNVIGGKYTPPSPPRINSKTAANGHPPQQTPIDDILDYFHLQSLDLSGTTFKETKSEAKTAIYNLLVGEAVTLLDTYETPYKSPYKYVRVAAVPVTKIKEILEANHGEEGKIYPVCNDCLKTNNINCPHLGEKHER